MYMCVKSLQSYLTLCDPVDYNLPGSSVHGICQARTLEWVAMPSCRGSFRPRDRSCVSCIPGKPFSGSLSINDSQPCLHIRVPLEILLKTNIITYYRDLDLITVSHWYFSTASHVILIYGQS